MADSSSFLIIPVFIPHRGCGHRCLFCNQHSIAGRSSTSEEGEEIGDIITSWLARARPGRKVQVAFYGGSFTCLPLECQERMLTAISPFLQCGEVDGIRLSTRPDCIDAEICRFLKKMGVTTVELGVQSMDDTVLATARRGHTAEDCRLAAGILQQAGIEVGIQLMPGLPGEGTLSFLRGIRQVIALSPAFVRLYPVLVVKDSGLFDMYSTGVYRPLSLNRALALSRRGRALLVDAGIRVVRIGLQPSAALESALAAGPYHPAFGELVAARDWLQRVRALFAGIPKDKVLTVRISTRDQSAFLGPKRQNMRRLAELGLAGRLVIETDQEMKRGTLNYAVG